MKIAWENVLYIPSWFWKGPAKHRDEAVVFYPENKRIFLLGELKAIVAEMEKMNG